MAPGREVGDRMRLGSVLLCFGLFAWSASKGSGQTFVDSFNTGAFSLSIPANENQGSVSVNTSHLANSLGGNRKVTISQEFDSSVPHSTAGLQTGTGYLDYTRNQNGSLSLDYGFYNGVSI